ncbi:pilus assembly protein TadC [Salipiger aestuarii]|uniref:Tight adherence protein C n=1 Tax=Salipiger aestuarii TaxID=568098 RepID=A0A327YV32_9RHOB|nr:type II secretion system F family protein [Salipiger aestuarii]EIE48889.1 TadC family type II/IV secretion system protein [Citreicella sp. 357]KAA8610358.1 pilus assembly protein TadC [Salipiger aestuarii]KAA8616373.1 pilus assembly protein TadC [Salipiger aestuarii]KAB2543532.1 pilus assembly protein TadC [Salipiger aestuarii]RAK21899.1 tight adherence protein C [Salipiger aestuarii]
MFDTLNAMLVDMLGPAGPLMAVAALALLLILAAIPLMLSSKPDPMDKLAKSGRTKIDAETKAILRDTRRNAKLNKYAQYLEPQSAEELGQMRLKLLQAGYRTRDAVRLFYLAQMVLGIGLLVAGTVYYLLFIDSPESTMQQKLIYILLPGTVGYLAPKYWIQKRVEERRKQIEEGFPDALDMMLVCVEAGQALDQAIVRVAGELHASYPALADEFEIISHEMKAGKDKSAVLNDMGERCGVQDVASFVTVLNQAASFGTSIADALRIYASEMRDKRVMRAEEKANKLPTKMTLTTMMFTVPPLLIILVGPSIVGITQLGTIAP